MCIKLFVHLPEKDGKKYKHFSYFQTCIKMYDECIIHKVVCIVLKLLWFLMFNNNPEPVYVLFKTFECTHSEAEAELLYSDCSWMLGQKWTPSVLGAVVDAYGH